jgi:hypothetical protein
MGVQTFCCLHSVQAFLFLFIPLLQVEGKSPVVQLIEISLSNKLTVLEDDRYKHDRSHA